MTQDMQAHVFITTLAEMLDADRERRSLQMQRQHKAHAERFRQAFRNSLDGGLQSSGWAPNTGRAARELSRTVPG